MENLLDKINKIEDLKELDKIYADVFNFENVLTDDDLELQFNCFQIKSTIKQRINSIISNWAVW